MSNQGSQLLLFFRRCRRCDWLCADYDNTLVLGCSLCEKLYRYRRLLKQIWIDEYIDLFMRFLFGNFAENYLTRPLCRSLLCLAHGATTSMTIINRESRYINRLELLNSDRRSTTFLIWWSGTSPRILHYALMGLSSEAKMDILRLLHTQTISVFPTLWEVHAKLPTRMHRRDPTPRAYTYLEFLMYSFQHNGTFAFAEQMWMEARPWPV